MQKNEAEKKPEAALSEADRKGADKYRLAQAAALLRSAGYVENGDGSWSLAKSA